MTNIKFILSLAHVLVPLLDVKQQLLTGTKHSNTHFLSEEHRKDQLSRSSLPSSSKLLRNSKEILDDSSYYINPLVTTNSPDPGVVRLVDGSGWAMVTTSNNVSRRSNSYAFSMHYSRGRIQNSKVYLVSNTIA